MTRIFVWTGLLLATALGGTELQRTRDETAALQSQVDALPPGGTLTLEARTYHFQGVTLSKSLTIQGQGPGRTVGTRGTVRPFFQIRGRGTEVTIRQLSLDGGRLEAAGIEAQGIKLLRLSDLRVSRCGTPPPGSLRNDSFGKPVDGVYARDVDRAEVYACRFEANARDGFIGIPVRQLFFARNVSSGNGRMGCTSDIDPEQRLGGPLQVVYQDNEVTDCGTGGLHVESKQGLPVADALFERNRISHCGNRDWGYSWGLVIGQNAQGILRGNTITGTGAKAALKEYRNGIHISRPGGAVLIEGNTILDSGRSGISLSESPHAVTLTNNRIAASGGSGVTAYLVSQLHVTGTTVEGSAKWGLWCRLCPNGVLEGNRFRDNSRGEPGQFAAIHAEASVGLRVKDNDLGGQPHRLGLELGADMLGVLTVIEGNTFEGRRSHPRLSTAKTAN